MVCVGFAYLIILREDLSKMLKEIKEHLDLTCSADANLQHLMHVFEGYRACLAYQKNKEIETEPYSPGSARELSFKAGWKLATKDIIANL
jgi:hypothetical protein